MTRDRKIIVRAAVSLLVLLGIVLIIRLSHRLRSSPFAVTGSVVIENADSRKESPITDVDISAIDGSLASHAKSDFSGYFKLSWPADIEPHFPVTIQFRHPDYEPVDLSVTGTQRLHVVRMLPVHGEMEAELNQDEITLTNVLVRYSTETTQTDNVGTGVKTFQVSNVGNVPCNKQLPCSPDGKWKAATDSASLDAGEGNIFQDARLSCIAGPCPFTRVENDGFSKPGRNIKVSVLNWSDTATFLLQAEVFRTQLVDTVRRSYPVIFGRSLNFTLPPDARGAAIEAELNNAQVVFILAPIPEFSWANCKVKVETNQTKDYRCELKPGYKF